MPTHETVPGQKRMVFVKPDEGKFTLKDGENVTTVSAIEGNLDMFRIEFDSGNAAKRIEPYNAFIMHISDDDCVYRIKMNLDRNFVFSVARAAGDLQKGEYVLVEASLGDDPNITWCNFKKRNEDGTLNVRPNLATFSKDRAVKLKEVEKVIRNHPAYSEKPEKSETSE